MSQSATFYSISQKTFDQLEKLGDEQPFHPAIAKDYLTFQGSFMGFEYVLSKGKDDSTTEIINELFNPKKFLGRRNTEDMIAEEQFNLYEGGNLIPYLDPVTISRVDDFLDMISAADVQSNYDADELNRNGIYPELWHNDNSPNQVFNERQLSGDLSALKIFIKLAKKERNIILVFIG